MLISDSDVEVQYPLVILQMPVGMGDACYSHSCYSWAYSDITYLW
jgi:hypothetical protein